MKRATNPATYRNHKTNSRFAESKRLNEKLHYRKSDILEVSGLDVPAGGFDRLKSKPAARPESGWSLNKVPTPYLSDRACW